MQVSPTMTPSDAATVAGAMVWAYQSVTGVAPPSRSSWLLPLAQSALETGNWKSMRNWNVGFISQPNTSQPYYLLGNNPVRFAVYSSLGQGCLAMMRWLKGHGTLAYADANDPVGYTNSLQAGGYVGSDPSVYPPYEAGIVRGAAFYTNVTPKPYVDVMQPMTAPPDAWRRLGVAAAILVVSGATAYALLPKTPTWRRAPSRLYVPSARA